MWNKAELNMSINFRWVVVSIFSIILLLIPTIVNASSKPVLLSESNIGRVPNSNELIDSKYAIIAEFSDKTEVIYDQLQPDYNPILNDDGEEIGQYPFFFDRPDSHKGRIQARYTNVSSYKGRSLDLRFTILDWKKDRFGGGESMNFLEDELIGFRQSGYERVTVKMEYLYSDTLEPATDIPGSYMTFSDFDMFQSMAFTNSELAKFEDILVYDPTEVYTWKANDRGTVKTHIGSQDRLNRDPSDTKGWVTGLINSHEITFDWAKDYTKEISMESNPRPYNFVPIDRDRIGPGGSKYNRTLGDVPQERFEYVMEKPLRTDTPEPTKTISDRNGEPIKGQHIVEPNSEFKYNIHHVVPYETNRHWYTSYYIEDVIDSALDIKSVKVYDHNDKDVSSRFKISTNNNIVRVEAKNSSLNNQDFYGQIYRVTIDVKVKDTGTLMDIAGENNKLFNVENTAEVNVEGIKKSSNKVSTEIELPTTQIMMDKIQIYTNKASDGLPVRLDLGVEDYEEAYGDQIIELDIVDDLNNSVLNNSVKVTLDDIMDDTIELLITKNLSPNSVKDYTAVIKDYNETYLNADDDVDSITTEGHTAIEQVFTSDSFDGVVMTERELNRGIERYFEEIKLNYDSIRNMKSGYGFPLEMSVLYKNDLLDIVLNDIDEININTVTNVTAHVDSRVVDESFGFVKNGGYSLIELEQSDLVLDVENNQVNVSYRAPKAYMKVDDGSYVIDDGVTNYNTDTYLDAGNKLYVPVWIDDLGTYNFKLQSDNPIGSHQVKFDVLSNIEVVAYMLHHIDSETADKDELMLRFADKSDLPEDWLNDY